MNHLWEKSYKCEQASITTTKITKTYGRDDMKKTFRGLHLQIFTSILLRQCLGFFREFFAIWYSLLLLLLLLLEAYSTHLFALIHHKLRLTCARILFALLTILVISESEDMTGAMKLLFVEPYVYCFGPEWLLGGLREYAQIYGIWLDSSIISLRDS